MGCEWDIVGEEGLQFFGKMSASISHEIKNALAIISENAGLLEDYTFMTKKGKPIDPERLRSLSEKIIKQILRADRIVTNMNRFAHSTDESFKSVDVRDVVELMAELSARFAAMRGVTLEPMPPTGPVIIRTRPFLLQNLIWLCLDFAMDTTGEEKNVGLIAEKSQDGARIRFTHLEPLSTGPTDIFPTEKEKAMLRALGAKITANMGTRELIISLPGDIDK